MHRKELIHLLNTYKETWLTESHISTFHSKEKPHSTIDTFLSFVKENEDCFHRTNLKGHVTSSGLVVTPNLSHVLLTLHRKLNRWIQTGGHCDGDTKVDMVAKREAEEESGLKKLQFFLPQPIEEPPSVNVLPFDIDVHLIPANAREAEHYHYDVRFLLISRGMEVPQISDESKDVRWFTLADARAITFERSMHRQFEKVSYMKEAPEAVLAPRDMGPLTESIL